MASDAKTERIKASLAWMAEHPGEWLYWGDKRFSSTSRQVREPSFERRYISPSVKSFENHPFNSWKCGLWVRFISV